MKRSRTTISVDADLFEKAKQRWKALGYDDFSKYLAYLIEKGQWYSLEIRNLSTL